MAQRASWILSFSSCTSTSEDPPTLITATPPVNLPSLSYSFSLSYSEVVVEIYSSMVWTLSSNSVFYPVPPIMIVSSLVMITFLAWPKTVTSADSSWRPISSLMNCPPVAMAISYMVFLLLSPNPGDFTAATLRPPLSLLTTRVARASLSTSSATITRALLLWAACSR